MKAGRCCYRPTNPNPQSAHTLAVRTFQCPHVAHRAGVVLVDGVFPRPSRNAASRSSVCRICVSVNASVGRVTPPRSVAS